MNCNECDMCDGPICGLPCTHYWDCLEHENEEKRKKLQEQQTLHDIDENIAISLMLISQAINDLNEI